MAWYTKIIGTDGVAYHIFPGVPTDDTYKVGDAVPQAPLADKAGKGAFLDGLYMASPVDNAEVSAYRWVVIVEARIKAIIGPFPYDTKTGDTIPPRDVLFRQHGCRRLPVETWSDWAWAQKAKADEEARREAVDRKAQLYGLPQEEAAAIILRYAAADLHDSIHAASVRLPDGCGSELVKPTPMDLETARKFTAPKTQTEGP